MKSLGKERNKMLLRLQEALKIAEEPDEIQDIESAIKVVQDAIEFAEFWSYVETHMGLHRVQHGKFTEYDTLMLQSLLEKYANNIQSKHLPPR